eukprot:Gregarina_sp_Pseudo_9__1325@NODE_1888_length_1274_cov_850_894737_g1752_i0_p1_GENE_NODE_1888_length_1274_cov_850_894737_g1752_i0NODE_1888_length_1274_cov_850_894737_g1752_i0_p1_ORF_typecomplete_len250_score51_97PAGK/PF15284_6/0_13PAGK/PF15284_6/2_3e03_NODE_1888_length_1274_cov_850_894737_g1752_i03631112
MVNFAAALVSLALAAAQGSAYPHESDFQPLPEVLRGHEDLYIGGAPPYGMYNYVTILGVFSSTGATDLTDALYNWKSGLLFFDEPANTSIVYGYFNNWTQSIVEVDVTLATGEVVTLEAVMARREGCFSDWETFTTPANTDLFGEEWPASQLEFTGVPTDSNFRLMVYTPSSSQSPTDAAAFFIDHLECTSMTGNFATPGFPLLNFTLPAANYRTVDAIFHGNGKIMTLEFADNRYQTYIGTKSAKPSA